MFQLARFHFDILALWMEPMLTFCALEHQIVVGSCGPLYKDFFFDSGFSLLFFTVPKNCDVRVDWFRPVLITKMAVNTRHLGDFLASLTKKGYLYWIPQRNISIWNRHSCEQTRNPIYACLKVLLGFCNFDRLDKTQPVLRTATLQGGGVFHIFIQKELLKKNLLLLRSYVVHWNGHRTQRALLSIHCFCYLLLLAYVRRD